MPRLCCLAVIYSVTLNACLTQADSSHDPIRLVTYNVWYGFTKTPARKPRWIEWMKEQRPDLVCLQELNGYTSDQLQQDARAWGHEHSVLLKEDGFPTGITSRWEILDVHRLRDGFHHGAMRVKTNGIYIYVIHLHPSNWRTRKNEIELVMADVAQLPADANVLLVGDFNTFSKRDRPHYAENCELESFFADRDQRFGEVNLREGQLDYSVIDRVEAGGFVDLESRFRKAFQGTFPTKIEKPGEHGDLRRLDYVFANPLMARRCLDARSIVNAQTAQLSDHYPLVVDFRTAP